MERLRITPVRARIIRAVLAVDQPTLTRDLATAAEAGYQSAQDTLYWMYCRGYAARTKQRPAFPARTPFHLYHLTDRGRRWAERTLREVDMATKRRQLHITDLRRQILRLLLDADDTVTVAFLAEKLGVTRDPVYPAMARFTEHSLVTGHRPPGRSQSVQYQLTPWGRTQAQSLLKEDPS